MENNTQVSSYMTVLTGEKSSRKIYTVVEGAANTIPITSFRNDSVEYTVNNITDVYQTIINAAKNPKKYIIRGRGKFPQQFDEQRCKLGDNPKFYEHATAWVCFDFDKVKTPLPATSRESIEWIIKNRLPDAFHEVSYVLQWSSSAGIEFEGNPIKLGTNAHVFFYLDRALTEYQLKGWFIDNTAVDNAVFKTVQPIFIHPVADLQDDRLTDTLPVDGKIQLIEKSFNLARTPADSILNRVTAVVYKDRVLSLIDVDFNNVILNELRPFIIRDNDQTINIFSKQEKTKGGFFCL